MRRAELVAEFIVKTRDAYVEALYAAAEATILGARFAALRQLYGAQETTTLAMALTLFAQRDTLALAAAAPDNFMQQIEWSCAVLTAYNELLVQLKELSRSANVDDDVDYSAINDARLWLKLRSRARERLAQQNAIAGVVMYEVGDALPPSLRARDWVPRTRPSAPRTDYTRRRVVNEEEEEAILEQMDIAYDEAAIDDAGADEDAESEVYTIEYDPNVSYVNSQRHKTWHAENVESISASTLSATDAVAFWKSCARLETVTARYARTFVRDPRTSDFVLEAETRRTDDIAILRPIYDGAQLQFQALRGRDTADHNAFTYVQQVLAEAFMVRGRESSNGRDSDDFGEDALNADAPGWPTNALRHRTQAPPGAAARDNPEPVV